MLTQPLLSHDPSLYLCRSCPGHKDRLLARSPDGELDALPWMRVMISGQERPPFSLMHFAESQTNRGAKVETGTSTIASDLAKID